MARVEQQTLALARAQAVDRWLSYFVWYYDLVLVTQSGKRLRRALPHLQGPRVLEVSFGVGYLMAQYAGRFQTSGLDFNPRYVETARRRLDNLGLHANLVQGDAHDLPYADASFETLLNTDAFTLYSDPQRAMREFYRVLVPGGRLVMLEYGYPSDGNKLGRFVVNYARWAKIPYVDFPMLLRDTGFTFEDYPVGWAGSLHMYVATKPR